MGGLVGMVYDAVCDGSRWSEVVKGVAAETGGGAAALFLSGENRLVVATAAGGVIEGPADRYVPAMLAATPIGLNLVAELFRRYRDLPMAAEWSAIPAGDEACAYRVEGQPAEFLLAAALPEGRPGDNLGELATHLRRALDIGRRLSTAQQLGRMAADIYSRLPFGVLHTDEKGKLLYANAVAEDILRRQDGLLLDRMRTLRANSSGDTMRLHSAIFDLSQDKPSHDGHAVQIARRQGARPLSLLLLGSPGLSGSPALGIAMLVQDPDASPPVCEKTLAQLYQLTDAEARLVKALVNGQRLEEAAEAFGVTRNTVRTQLAKILQKTHTSRQTDLVRLVLLGPATLGQPAGDALRLKFAV